MGVQIMLQNPVFTSSGYPRGGIVGSYGCCCCCLVVKSCLTLCDPNLCSLLGSSVYGISQARILEWIAISISRGSSQPRDRNRVSHIGITTELPGKPFTIAWVKYFLKIFHVLALLLCSPKHSCGFLNTFILDINKLRTLQGNLSSSLGLDTELVLCIILSKCTLYLLTISYFKVSESYSK